MAGRIDYGHETWSEKFKRKFTENPWVPVGCLATTTALIMASVKMRTGRSKDMQYWLRARVAFQGLTVLALLAGSMAIQSQRNGQMIENADNLPRNEATAEHLKEQKRGKEKAEFEERLKEAEIAHAEENAAAARLLDTKAKNIVPGGGGGVEGKAADNNGGSWTRWFGWASSSSKPKQGETDKKA